MPYKPQDIGHLAAGLPSIERLCMASVTLDISVGGTSATLL